MLEFVAQLRSNDGAVRALNSIDETNTRRVCYNCIHSYSCVILQLLDDVNAHVRPTSVTDVVDMDITESGTPSTVCLFILCAFMLFTCLGDT
jgi:hypothetical protein